MTRQTRTDHPRAEWEARRRQTLEGAVRAARQRRGVWVEVSHEEYVALCDRWGGAGLWAIDVTRNPDGHSYWARARRTPLTVLRQWWGRVWDSPTPRG